MKQRRYRTPRGQVSNAGDFPRFIGIVPCKKATEGSIVFSSLSEMYVIGFLKWSKRVRRIAFEAAPLRFRAVDDLPALLAWPDFETELDNSEIEWVEAKYSRESLKPKPAAKLTHLAAHCKREQRRFRVVYRKDLEANGFIDTIMLLRQYGELEYSDGTLEAAVNRLSKYPSSYLEHWRKHARHERVPIDVLYHLLYHERLPLLYRPMLPVELQRCRD